MMQNRLNITKESAIIVFLCCVDLVFTIICLENNSAYEGNPFMSFWLEHGIIAFIIAKMCLVIFPIIIMEWGKQYKPDFVKFMLRTTIIAYISLYLVLFIKINLPTIMQETTFYYPPGFNVESQR
ncbi:MAG: DUF5658 family protein [Armatimonadota bacterium]